MGWSLSAIRTTGARAVAMATRVGIALTLAACGDEAADSSTADGGADAGADASTTPDAAPECSAPGDCPLLEGVGFEKLGEPSPGYNVITDIVSFSGRLFASASANPLNAFGAAVASTADGVSFADAVIDETSQGFLRLRVIDGALFVPDGDPNGYDPGWVWVSADGAEFERTTVPGAVHTFDVASYEGALLASNGMLDGGGSLCALDAGGESWTEIQSTPYQRLRFLAVFAGRLYAAKRMIGADEDYLVWSGPAADGEVEAVDALEGEANTWTWFSSAAAGRLYWSFGAAGSVGVAATGDGETWQSIEALDGEFVSAFAELDGNVYALGNKGLWGTSDGTTFVRIAEAPSGTTFAPVPVDGGYNAEATASLAVHDGRLWCGSSTDGHLYRVE
jgi:hypothetical protein